MRFKWIDRLMINRLSRRYGEKTDRSGRFVTWLGEAGALNRDDDIAKFMSTVYHDPFVGIAVARIENTIATLPLEVGRMVEIDGKKKYEVDDSHPAKVLLDSPNPENTGFDLKRHLVQSLLLSAETFLTFEKEGGKTELYMKPTNRFKVQMSKATGKRTGYQYTAPDGSKTPYGVDEVVHILNFDASNPYYGKSLLSALWKFIQLNHASMGTNLAMVNNGGIPSHIAMSSRPLNADQINQLKAGFDKSHGGVENKGKLGILPDVITDIKQIQNDFKDMQFTELTKLIREIVFATFGLPPFVGGVMEYANYANALIQDVSYWRNGIIPILAQIEDGLTNKLLPMLFGDVITSDYVVRFNLDNVEALQGDRKDKAQVGMLLVKSGIWTPNEARDKLYEMMPIEGGDELVKPAAPFSQPQEEEPEEEDEENPEDEKPEKSLKRKTIGLKKIQRETHWKKFDARLIPKDSKMESIIRKFFKDQANRVVGYLDFLTVGGKVKSALSYYGRKNPLEPDPIFILSEENQELIKVAMPELKSILRDAGEDFYDDFAIGYGFDITSPNVKKAIVELESQLIKVNDVNYNVIRNILADSYSRGHTIKDTANAIRDEYTNMAGYRAKRIARTEVLGAYNSGTQIGYVEAGIEKKEWLASLDSHTRDTHAYADGQQVAVNDYFQLSVPMKFPGDPNAPAGEIVNCRCTTVPVFE